MPGRMKDARWMRAIDEAEKEGIAFLDDLEYPEKQRRLDEAQKFLDEHPEQVNELAKRFNNPEPRSQAWVEESSTAFAIRAAKADGVRQALLYARVKVAPEGTAEDLANTIDEYLADLERPIHTPSRIHKEQV